MNYNVEIEYCQIIPYYAMIAVEADSPEEAEQKVSEFFETHRYDDDDETGALLSASWHRGFGTEDVEFSEQFVVKRGDPQDADLILQADGKCAKPSEACLDEVFEIEQ
jgi:hypothetical protein